MRKLIGLGACGDPCGAPRKNAATRIFETARELFYQRGVRAVGVDEIVCQAGVTKPSLYRSFESKDALVAACLESYAAEASDAMDARIVAAGDDPRAQLRAIVAHYADQMTSPGFRGCPMTNTAVEFPEEGHPGRPVVEDCKSKLRQHVVGIARKLSADDPEMLADGLILLIEGAYATHHVFGSQGPASALVRSADRLIDAHVQG
ncbi:TetR/AcrR family transcriptional regulator [Sphingosinicella sp. CPCC 101087]|uniref:TetR/AcrR family transcriptional regulator n=1 Tax=Sphingosinicella sp. CPCC 101087 TaxID=2497754 RepID=UPI00101DF0FA|nr:TetR/AcrR family transcriptional regulator [Sphingosinicella sp. CPCC 101087]